MSQDSKQEHQITLERLFNKNQTIKRVRQEFEESENIDFKTFFEENEIPVDFGFDLLAQMALHKRTDINTLCGIMYKHLQNMQETIDLIKKCAELDIIDYNPAFNIFITKITISEDVQAEIDRFQFPLPMVVEPLEVKCNSDSGYILSKSSLILKNNYHTDDICLDHINRMNKIKLEINHEVSGLIKNSWSNINKPKEGETDEEYQARVRAFEKYNKNSYEVMEILTKEGNEFYLTHKYDKRGRVYSQGYHVNYQGNSWNKAVIDFCEKEITV